MKKIWQSSVGTLNKGVESYTVGDDFIYDMVIFPYDIRASKAHAEMLGSIGVLSEKEVSSLLSELDELLKIYEQGEVELNPEDEDCHTYIEAFLTKKLGNVGKKIHTGRSRNDQVLVATRLYMIDSWKRIEEGVASLIESFFAIGEKHSWIVLPGYTHTQQAMLSSVEHWLLSFAESLINDLSIATSTRKILGQNPLGTAAGFWVTFPLDRDMTAKKLGFHKNIVNSIFAQGSRGKFESLYLESLSQIMMTLSRFASDLLLFTSREFSFFSFDDSLTTGSSIMPQKKNLDTMELVRGKTTLVQANQVAVKNITKGLISGYHRDFQLLKKLVIDSSDITLASIEVIFPYLEGMRVHPESILKSIKKDIVAADIANELVEKNGISFRDAYLQVKDDLESIEVPDYSANIASKKSLGSAGNLWKELIKKHFVDVRSGN